MALKIHILFPFIEGPWGGGNQFLKALRDYFKKQGYYSDVAEQADVILFNSSPKAFHTLLPEIYRLKNNNSNLIVINRIDGPVFLIRNKDIEVDKLFFLFNRNVCDATVFQSEWSKVNCKRLGMQDELREFTILNAPNPLLFNDKQHTTISDNTKIRLVATSWSSNWEKGFESYQWLDENLDFSKYEMAFIGNSPVIFKNIKLINPMASNELSHELKKYHIFITASKKDPCSNSLIEAMHCGLPAIGLNDGGHTEIIGKGGCVFDSVEQIPNILNNIVENYENYRDSINLPMMDDVGLRYYNFLLHSYTDILLSGNRSKRFSLFIFLKLRVKMFVFIFKSKVKRRLSCG